MYTHAHAHTDTHTHIRTDIFSKPLFWTQGTSKRIIPLKSQSQIFLLSQYFLHTYCIWEKVKKTAAKVSARANIVQKLAGTSWGADAKVLRTSSLSLVYF